MRVALVHDWLTGMRGGERCLEALCRLFPESEIFTLVHRPGSVSPVIEARPIHPSFLQRVPGIFQHYRRFLPLFPAAVQRFDLRGFDLVLSTSHCVAKAAPAPRGVPHVCYCFTPMRYIWDQYAQYFGPGRAAWPVRGAMALLAPRLRAWDRAAARGVTRFVAISQYVRGRIARCYHRQAEVVYPPVELARFRPDRPREDFFLAAGALVPYKRFDLAIRACTRLGRRLVVAGHGPERRRLERIAGPQVEFTGWVDDAALARLLETCRALLHPAEEEFGLLLVEAQSAGAPVLAFGVGGAREIVLGEEDCAGPLTGLFFPEQTVDGAVAAIERFDPLRFDPAAARANAERFTVERFRRGILEQIERALAPAETPPCPLHL